MAIEEILKASSRGPSTQNPQEDANVFTDVLAAPFRGVEGALQGIYDLADYATGDDLLPDYNNRFLGRSQTFAGDMVEGVTQFMTGFVPIAGQASRVGMLTKVASTGKKALNLKGYAAAGAVADFTVFQAQEERLSNLIESFPSLSNPVTAYLAADEDDGEIEGRFKNALEGLALGGLADGLFASVKAIKRGRKGEDPQEVLLDLEDTLFSEQRDQAFLRSEGAEASAEFNKIVSQKLTGKSDPTNAYDMLKVLTEDYQGEMRPLFDALLTNAESSLRDAEFEFPLVAKDNGKAATYDPKTHKITFTKGGFNTFAHELLHAATSRELYLETARLTGDPAKMSREAIQKLTDSANTGAAAGLYRSYDAVVKKLGKEAEVYDGTGTNVYGLTNIHEFVTEAFTNPEFRQMLSKIPSEGEPSKTIFDTFMEAVRKMLGLSNEQASLLDDVMRDTEGVLRQQEANFESKFDYLKEIDGMRGLGQRRTLDDRGDNTLEEGQKAPVSEMQQDIPISTRNKTLNAFKITWGVPFRGMDISNVPNAYLEKSLTFDSLSAGVKNRIALELDSRKTGRSQYNEPTNKQLEQQDARVSKQKMRKDKDKGVRNIEPKAITPVYRTAGTSEQILRGESETPEQLYANYLASRNQTGGKASPVQQRFKEYMEGIEIDEMRRGGTTNIKNPRIQGKSQRESDLIRQKRINLPSDPITDARNRGRMFAEGELGQRDIDQSIEDSISRLANDLETGGDQAVLNAAKGIRSTTQAVALVQAIARNLTKAETAKAPSYEELVTENAELVGTLGGKEADYAATIASLNKKGVGLTEYRNAQKAVYKLIDTMSSEVVDLANKAKEARSNPNLNKEQLEVEFLSSLDQLNELQRIWSLMGREAAFTMLQRKFLLDPSGKYRVKQNIGFDSKAATPNDYARYKNESQVGTMTAEKMVDTIAGAKDALDAKKRIKKTSLLAKETMGGKAMDVIMEYWMNSLLSGPTTQVVNLLGNSLTMTIRVLEQATGAVLTANPALARATLRYGFDAEAIADSFKVAAQTWGKQEATLTQGSRMFDDTLGQSQSIAADGDNVFAKAINALGTVVRVPSRALLVGDEFFKQMNYRSYVKTQLAYEAMQKGAKDGTEIAEYVQKNFDNFITAGARAYNEKGIYLDAVQAAQAKGLMAGKEQDKFVQEYLEKNKFDETRGGLADAALGYAEENTFTKDLNSDTALGTLSEGLNNLKNKGGFWQTLNFVVPFLRTPTNILQFALDRTPLGNASELVFRREKLKKEIFSDDPTVRAQAVGRLATSTAVVSSALYYVAANKEFITGGGPPNRDELEALRMSGWRPYSIKVNGTYISYQRTDPIATVLGLFADIVEGYSYNDLDGVVGTDMMAITVMALTNNVTNKSYVKGLDTLLDVVRDPVGNFKPFVGNIAGGFAPTLLTQAQNMADERVLRETRTAFDYFLRRVPVVESTLPSRRNFLGEEMINKNSPYMTGIINPFYPSKESTDIVDKELAALQHGFSQPPTKLHNAIEMRDVYNADGRQAFDRMLELSSTTKIAGKTLRQQLRAMMNSNAYQSLPVESADELGEKSPRIKAVQRLVRTYRRKAKAEMLKEFPELKQSIIELQKGRLQYRDVQ